VEIFKIASDFIGRNGTVAFVILVAGLVSITSCIRELAFLWKKYIKKSDSSNPLETRVKNLEDSTNRLTERDHAKERDYERRMESMEITLGEHLKKEQAEDIRIALMEQGMAHTAGDIKELKDNQGAIFKMISAIKDHLIPGK
jgi:hypothetical protein